MATSPAGLALTFWDPLLFRVPLGKRLTISASKEWPRLGCWNRMAGGLTDLRAGTQAVVTASEPLGALAEDREPSPRESKIDVDLCPHSTPGYFSFCSGELAGWSGMNSGGFVLYPPMFEIRASGASPCEWCACRHGLTCELIRKPLGGTNGDTLVLPDEAVERIVSYLSLRWRDDAPHCPDLKWDESGTPWSLPTPSAAAVYARRGAVVPLRFGHTFTSRCTPTSAGGRVVG